MRLPRRASGSPAPSWSLKVSRLATDGTETFVELKEGGRRLPRLRPSTPPASWTTISVFPEREAWLLCSAAATTAFEKTEGTAAPIETTARPCWMKSRRLSMTTPLGEVELGRSEEKVSEPAQLLR